MISFSHPTEDVQVSHVYMFTCKHKVIFTCTSYYTCKHVFAYTSIHVNMCLHVHVHIVHNNNYTCPYSPYMDMYAC